MDNRLRSQHHSVGNAVASIKELTLCLRAAWYKRRDKEAAAQALGIEPVEFESEFPVSALTRMHIGTAWGDLLNPEAERRIEIDTIHGIISGRVDLDLKEDEWKTIPVELKATYYSPKKTLAEMGQYVEQLAGYALATPECGGHAMLGVLHLGAPPLFRVFDINFEDHELDAWEAELTRRVGVVIAPEVLPSLADHYDWECRYCNYFEKNGGPCPGSKGKTRGFFMTEEE